MKKIKLVFLSILCVITSGLLIASVSPNFQTSIYLPKPNLNGISAANSVIAQQHTADELLPKNVTAAEISQILWGMQGITGGNGFRSAPSASAISPMQLYVAHGGTSDLPPGVYKYLPKQNSLEKISALPATVIQDNVTLDQTLRGIKTFVIVVGAYDRTVANYGDKGYLYVDLEVGHIVGNGILQLNALDMVTKPVYDFDSSAFQRVLGIAETPFVVLPIGSPMTQTQLEPVQAAGKSFEQALAGRRSIRDYLQGTIPFNDIAKLIAPSFNNMLTFEIAKNLEFHIVAENVGGIESGIYTLKLEPNKPVDESLLVLYKRGHFLSDLQNATISGAAIGGSQVSIVVSLKQNYVDTLKNNPMLLRQARYQVGMLTQNFLIQVSNLDLGTVSLGALEPQQVASVLGRAGEIEPIYVLPVGITPEYIGEKAGVQLNNIGTVLGFVACGAFVLAYFGTINPIRRLLRAQYKHFHLIIGIVAVAAMNIHFIIMHGQAKTILDLFSPITYGNGFVYLVQNGFHIPLGMPDAGHFLANLALVAMNVTTVTGILIRLKQVRYKKWLLKTHKVALVSGILFMIVHIYLNSLVFGSNPMVFLLLNGVIYEIYLLSKIIHAPAKQKTTPTLGRAASVARADRA